MSILKSGAEIRAQLDETNEAVNLLQEELGQAQTDILKQGKKLPPFPYINFSAFVTRWSAFYEESSTSVIKLNLGSTYDEAAQYLQDCHKWRKRAVKDGALPESKKDDPYSEPPKDSTPDYIKGGMIIAGLYLLARLLGK